jgi:hypothetical protein
MVLGAYISASTTFGQENLEFDADLDPAGSDTRTVRFRARDSSGSCRHLQRFRPGQWQAGFPFTVYEMSCQHRRTAASSALSTTITATYYFVPELAAELSCGERSRVQSDAMFMDETTSNVRVVREGDNVIRVKCDYETNGASMQGGAPTSSSRGKGEREDVITLQ